MKMQYLIYITIVIGITTLFLFPEPETNFLAYAGTALAFILLTISLIIIKKHKK